MKTKAAAKTAGKVAKYLQALAQLMANKKVAANVKDAAAALTAVQASLNRKANRKAKAHTFTVTGFAPAA